MAVLAELDGALTADLTSLDDDALTALSSRVRAGVKALSGLRTRIAGEAKRREETGSASPAEDTIDPNDDQSADETARDQARAGLAGPLPVAGGAAADGSAKVENADHLAAATARLSPTELQRLARRDHDIAHQLASMRPEDFRRWLGRLIAAIRDRDDELSAAERAIQASALRLLRRPDGNWDVIGRLDDERGTVANDIVERRARQLAAQRPPGERAVTNNDRAAALFDLLTRRTGGTGPLLPPVPAERDAGDGEAAPGGFGCLADDDLAAPVRMGVGVIVDAATLLGGPYPGSVAEHWRGDPIDPGAAARLACDTDVYAILFDHIGAPTRVGRMRRGATREQRLALRALYPTCPIDGTTPFTGCEIHHVTVRFADGGVTELENLLPISKAWHHRIHDQGWTLTMDPDRTLHIHRPDGSHYRTIAAPLPITRHGP
ncbi:MAG: HNH endonuclease signature motif containing protein [Acidimicrobiales bacterium]